MRPMMNCQTVSLALAILSLSFSAHAASPPPLTKIRFVTDWKAQAEHGGFYEALAEGLYKKAGLDVTIIASSRSTSSGRTRRSRR